MVILQYNTMLPPPCSNIDTIPVACYLGTSTLCVDTCTVLEYTVPWYVLKYRYSILQYQYRHKQENKKTTF